MPGVPSKTLPDLTDRLVKNGDYEKYVSWRKEYTRWRKGAAQGARGEVTEAAMGNADNKAWRDKYRAWRQGSARGTGGDIGSAMARPLVLLLSSQEGCQPQQGFTRMRSVSEGSCTSFCSLSTRCSDEPAKTAPAVVYDVVVADESGSPALLPVDGPEVPAIRVKDLPLDALLTVRTFRFFEDHEDEHKVWEQELLNVNSGSLFWLAAHMAPGMHSRSGAKYGEWFTIHYIQVYVKHFSSAYHMALEGNHLAKTFGATPATTKMISGQKLPQGYFWYVSPASDQPSLQKEGWQHLCRAGPFDGSAFADEWTQSGSPLEARPLQQVLDRVTERSMCN